jgi:glycosyltransferase involved in cell wall biosynthesis
MRILFLTQGTELLASSRTRVFQYLPFLLNDKTVFRVLTYSPQKIFGIKISLLKIERLYHAFIWFKLLLLGVFYNIIFIQKILLSRNLLGILKLLNKKLVFDFDDAIYMPSISADFNMKQLIHDRFRDVILMSDLVILENDDTRHYVEKFNPNILMILGPIDTIRYVPKVSKHKDKVIIGWIGSPSNTMYLELIFPVLKKLSKTYQNIYFSFIGAGPVNFPNLHIKQVAWDIKTEVDELQEFDIGIMPLIDDDWARGKGGYKLLQYMAVGIPSVASPVGVNKELIQEGFNGFLAEGEGEWYDKLSQLITNAEKRKVMGINARQFVVEKYSFFIAAPRLIEALKEVAQE